MKNILVLLAFPFLFITCTTQTSPSTHNVYDYGAKGDGVTNDQGAIQMAIDACNNTGGTVLFPEGTFLSGQLLLGSNMTLHIDSAATLLGIQSDDEMAYPHHMIETEFPNRMLQDCQRRLIYGNHVQNVSITGKGTIDGQGDYDPWMNVKEIGTEKDRPSILAFVGSKKHYGIKYHFGGSGLLDTGIHRIG